MKRLVSKICLSILWIAAVLLGVFTAVFGIPEARAWIDANGQSYPVSGLSDMMKMWEDWTSNTLTNPAPDVFNATTWGVTVMCALIGALLLLSIIPLCILRCRKKIKGPKGSELHPAKGDSLTPFVDAKGNYGHVVVSGDIPSPKAKYASGLSEKQKDFEFDWHNYVHHTPVVRIVFGVILGIAALALLALRAWDYMGLPASLEPYIGPLFTQMDNLFVNGIFQQFAAQNAFALGSYSVSVAQIMDFVLAALILWSFTFLFLLVLTFFGWVFRRPGAKRRAARARKKYEKLLGQEGHELRFAPSADIAVGVTVPERTVTGEVPEGDVEDFGTGIAPIKTVEGNYEGNLVNDSVTSVSLSSFHNDVLILGKPLIEHIAKLSPTEEKPDYQGIEEYLDGQGHALPIEEIPPVQQPVEEPAFHEEPVEEPVWTDRPSDKTPDYWYARNPVEEKPVVEEEQKPLVEEKPAIVLPAVETKPAEPLPVADIYHTVVYQPRPSDRSPEYWYKGALADDATRFAKVPAHWYETSPEPVIGAVPVEEGPVQEDDLDRRILQAIEPSHLIPVDSTKAAEEEEEKVEAPVEEPAPASVPTPVSEQVVENDLDRRILNALQPENLRALEEEGESEVRPSDEKPERWYGQNEAEPATYGDGEIRPSDRTPNYWYGEEKPVYLGPASWYDGSEIRPSDREPEYWYDRNPAAPAPVEEPIEKPVEESVPAVEEAEETPIEPGVKEYEFDRRVLNALNPFHLVPVEEETLVEPTQVQEVPEPEQSVEEPAVEEQPAVQEPVEEEEEAPLETAFAFEGERPSDYEPEHWYRLAEMETKKRPSDEEPPYWYQKHEPIKKPSVKPVGGLSFTPKDRPQGPKPGVIQPIKPVVQEPEAAQEPQEPAKPTGPVELASHKIHEAPKIKINPVEARIVRFQLKKIQSSYTGQLTPEEAFSKAVTNQTILVNPVLQGQGDAGSKYLARRASKEKSQIRKSGYVSAVSVNPVSEDKEEPQKATFDKPVSEFKSIREWANAKRQFEKQQKALAEEQAKKSPSEAPSLPKKPIDVVKPLPEKEEKPAQEEKKEAVRPIPLIKPIVPPKAPSSRLKGPVKPIKPIDPKKGE